MTTYTHSFDTAFTSSVIDQVFYSSDTEELYVQLTRTNWDGSAIVAGYASVPQDVYTQMELINTSRVKDGNKDASVGSYWNIFVKPNFSGLNTDGLELEPETVADDEAFTFAGITTPVEDVSTSEEVSVDSAELLLWTVEFDSDITEGDFNLRAADLNDAIQRFAQIAEVAGLENAVVVSATVHLNN